MDTGDTGFILICAALVLLMTPALALFYGGMVRKKNVLNTMMMSFIVLGMITIQWIFWAMVLFWQRYVWFARWFEFFRANRCRGDV